MYLHEGSFRFPDLDYNAQRNADHRGQGHRPPNPIAPVWISVDVVIFQRLILDQKEEEYTLKEGGEIS